MSRTDEFKNLIFALMPPGDLLTQELESEFGNFYYCFARELERLEQQGEFIPPDLDPRGTTLFLEDWERLLALPECGLPLGDTASRRLAVHSKLTSERSLTASYIQNACVTAGFDVTVTTSATVDHQFDVDWPSFAIEEFRTGTSVTGDRLGSWAGADALICLLDRIKPAWTTYILTTP